MNIVHRKLSQRQRRRDTAAGIIEPLVTAKRDHTLYTTYNRIAPGSDGRVHTAISVATTSGRMASSGGITEESQTNIQNIANKVAALDELYQVRDCLVADPGFQLVARDYSGAEALLVYAYSKDWEWLDRMLVGEDTHKLHAKEFFGCRTVEQVTPAQRKTAKNLVYGSFYSATARTVMVTFNKDYLIHGQRITESEVRRILDILYQLHPLQAWWEEVREELSRNKGWTRNCFGYRRVFRDPDEQNRLKDALSTYPQSTVAWLMNTGIPKLLTLDEAGVIELLHQNHDEILFQSLEGGVVEYTLAETKRLMEVPFTIHNRTLHIPTEAKVGVRWGKMEKAA